MLEISLVKSLKNEPLEKTSENSGVQLAKTGQKGCEKGHRTRQDARYRKLKVYTKSLVRYKLERARRRQVLCLAKKGLTQKEIASKLGVSTRTVKRDWKKLAPYLTGQFHRQIWEITAKQREKERQRYEGLTIKEELKLLKKDLKALKKRHLL